MSMLLDGVGRPKTKAPTPLSIGVQRLNGVYPLVEKSETDGNYRKPSIHAGFRRYDLSKSTQQYQTCLMISVNKFAEVAHG